MRKAGGKNPVEYLKVELNDLIISSVSASVAPESETVTENVTLNFAKVKLDYTPQDEHGNPMAAMPASWNIPGNAPVG